VFHAPELNSRAIVRGCVFPCIADQILHGDFQQPGIGIGSEAFGDG
jgi:hypothetical protein